MAKLISTAAIATALDLMSGCGQIQSPIAAAGTTSTTPSGGVTTITYTGGDTTITFAPTPPASTIYAFQSPSTGDASVLQFAASSSGSVAPVSTLVLPTPQVLSWHGIATDFNGNIYAMGNQIANQPSEILMYYTNAGPAPFPTQTIVGSSSTFLDVTSITIGFMGDICVETGSAGNAAILLFEQGTQTPGVIIKGDLTGLDGTGYMATDGSNLYVSTSAPGQILAFSPPAASGVFFPTTENMAPERVIGGSSTLLTPGILGMDVDATGDIYAVIRVPSTNSTEIVEFAAGASGNVAPIAIINGTIAGEQAVSVHVDEVGNLYVLCESQALPPSGASPLIAVFSAPVASGATPTSQFTSPAWTGSTGSFGLH